MESLESKINDPRVVVATLSGREYRFWFCPAAKVIAREIHGYTLPTDAEPGADWVESIYRQLWVAHLPFDPHLGFVEFIAPFGYHDAVDAVKALAAVMEKQIPQGDEKNALAGEDAG